MSLTEQEIGARLRLRDRNTFVRDADKAGDAIERLARRTERSSVVARVAQGAWSGLRTGIGAVVETATKAALVLGAVAVATGVAFVKMGVQTMVAWEQSTVAFKTMLGSQEKADQMMGRLRTFAIRTPFEMPQLIIAARNLRAMGIAGEGIIPMLRTIGDSAAALGHDSEGVVRIGRALGEMQAKGFASGEEMRQLANHGIRAWEYLATHVGKSIPETMKLAEKRQIGGAEAVTAILAGMAKEHGGLMEAQMDTIGGKWMMLKDQVRFAAMDMMMPFQKDIGKVLTWAIDNVDHFADFVRRKVGAAFLVFKGGLKGKEIVPGLGGFLTRVMFAGQLINRLFDDTPGKWSRAGDAMWGVIDPSGKVREIWDEFYPTLQDIGTILTTAVIPALRDLSPVVLGILSPLTLLDDIIGFIADHSWGARRAAEALLLMWAGYKALKLYSSFVFGFANKIQNARDVMTGAKDATRLLKKGLFNLGNTMPILRIRLAAMRAATAAWNGIVAVATGLQTAWNWAMRNHPILLLITVLAALGFALYQAYQKVGWFHDFVDGAWQLIQRFWDWMSENKLVMAAALTVAFGPIGTLLAGAAALYDYIVKIRDELEKTGKAKLPLGFGLEQDESGGAIRVVLPDWFKAGQQGVQAYGDAELPSPRGKPFWQRAVDFFGRGFEGLAAGGSITQKGTVMVGERGPELLSLSAGAKVVPLTDERIQLPDSQVDRSAMMPARLQIFEGAKHLFDVVMENGMDRAARI